MKRLIRTLLLTAVILAAIWYYLPTVYEKTPIAVKTISPFSKTVYETVNCSGVLKAANTARLSVGAPAEITALCVAEGDSVTKGQPILEYRLLSNDEIARQAGGVYYGEISSKLQELYGDLSAAAIFSAAEYYAASGELPAYFKDFYLPASAASTVNSSPSGILYAPFDGTVTAVNHKNGDIVSGMFVSAVVEDTDHIVADLQVPEAYLSRLAAGLPVNISGAAFGESVFAGRITDVGRYAVTTGGLLTKSETYIEATAAVFANQPLMSGLTVKACIFLTEYRDAVIIPHAAIDVDEEGNEFVYQYTDGYVVKRAVEYIYENDDGVVVSGGFSTEDQFVENPTKALYDLCPVVLASESEE